MQLKINRATSMKGILGGKRVFTSVFILMVTPAEQALFDKYKIGNEVVRGWSPTTVPAEMDALGTTTFARLTGGLMVENISHNFIFNVEALIIEACQRALRHCEAAEQFDGRDIVLELTGDQMHAVAIG